MLTTNKKYFFGLIALNFFLSNFSMEIERSCIDQIKEDIISDLINKHSYLSCTPERVCCDILKERSKLSDILPLYSIEKLKTDIKIEHLERLKNIVTNLSIVNKKQLELCRSEKLMDTKRRLRNKIIEQKLAEEIRSIQVSANALIRLKYRRISYCKPPLFRYEDGLKGLKATSMSSDFFRARLLHQLQTKYKQD